MRRRLPNRGAESSRRAEPSLLPSSPALLSTQEEAAVTAWPRRSTRRWRAAQERDEAAATGGFSPRIRWLATAACPPPLDPAAAIQVVVVVIVDPGGPGSGRPAAVVGPLSLDPTEASNTWGQGRRRWRVLLPWIQHTPAAHGARVSDG